MITETPSKPILFFDGVCNLCNSSVRFVLRHDRRKLFLFAPLQSAAGAVALRQMKEKNMVADSVLLYNKGNYYVMSDAVLHTFLLLGWPLRLVYAGIIIPRFLRDGVYKFVSRNRYLWFGRRKECMIPTPELKQRFLSGLDEKVK